MSLPQFTADASLYTTSNHYQQVASGAADIAGVVSPAVVKGTHCIRDPSCSTGYSKLFCSSYDPDSCEETGICCTPAPPVPPPPACPTGQQSCTDGGRRGCCPVGAHCCNDNHGCCKNGDTCRSWFGHHFCDPLFVTGGMTGGFTGEASISPRIV